MVCEGCLATHHALCWHQAGGCSALSPPPVAKQPPPEERPHRIRIRRHTWEKEDAVDRKRALVRGLREKSPTEGPAMAFQAPAPRAHAGSKGACLKCRRPFVLTRAQQDRCSRCTYSTWTKIAIVFALIVLWKLVF